MRRQVFFVTALLAVFSALNVGLAQASFSLNQVMQKLQESGGSK